MYVEKKMWDLLVGYENNVSCFMNGGRGEEKRLFLVFLYQNPILRLLRSPPPPHPHDIMGRRGQV